MTIDEKFSKLYDFVNGQLINAIAFNNDFFVRDVTPAERNNAEMQTHYLIFDNPRLYLGIRENHGWGPMKGRDKTVGKLQFRYYNVPMPTFERYLKQN